MLFCFQTAFIFGRLKIGTANGFLKKKHPDSFGIQVLSFS
ncbi:permease [Neisseria meningitidis]|uniref:Permease n=1 Tax=Neisseria meningitidis TaxID=487 RepID=A0AB37KG11_NEIME|nr:permease [Neisseria meningitidis]MBG8589062.1 permease [Neisseria meningitidis]MBG8648555.1 permease [Neisseria meningitidis]MBG8654539.1 permease [Neisseria meningitidis]MBG8668507.1 permease [Neisseria meningitidis]